MNRPPNQSRWIARRPGVRLLIGAAVVAAIVIGLSTAFFAGGGTRSCFGSNTTIVSNAPKIVGTKAPDVIYAGAGNNRILGEGGNDRICGGGGNDTILGGRGSDNISGEAGNDEIRGERGSERLDGGEGEDVLFGEHGNDSLKGSAGNGDRLDAGPGDDSLDGGAGDFDVVIGGPGRDAVGGGPGEHDIADYREAGGAVTVDLGAQATSGAEGERLSEIEDAVGGSGSDTLAGSAATPNRLDGGAGDDRLRSAGGGDEAFGGPGSDECDGGFAATSSCGNEQGTAGTAVELYPSIDGTTSMIVTGNEHTDAITINGGGGAYSVVALPGGNEVSLGDPGSPACVHNISSASVTCQGPISSIQVSLGGGGDTFSVGETVPANVTVTVDGGKGQDTIVGGRGEDTLYAGDDREPDSLEGGAGNDVLYGINIFHPRKDSGAARMAGGAGQDLLIGGQPCDGDSFSGRILQETDKFVVIQPNPLEQKTVKVEKSEISGRRLSKLSPMPKGLADVLTEAEILDLIAYLESNGNKNAPMFAK